MQTLGRLLILVIALALAGGPFVSAYAAPFQMTPAIAESARTAMAGMDASTGKCAPCKIAPGAMKDCLPACAGMPGVVPQGIVPLSVRAAIYELGPQLSFSGAKSRPDPYPPRLIILA